MYLNSSVSILSSIEPIFKTKDRLIKRILKEHTEYLEFKPYLRSMSSMTEEEENEIRKINCQFKNDLLYSGVFSAMRMDLIIFLG